MTYSLRRKPKSPPMGVRETRPDFPTHRSFVRRHACVVPGCKAIDIECCHIRNGLPDEDRGGTGSKPADWWTFPACSRHHRDQHQVGERRFAVEHKLDLRAIAVQLANTTTDQRMRAWLQERGRWPIKKGLTIG